MKFNSLLILFATFVIGLAVWKLHQASDGVVVTAVSIDRIPARVYRPRADRASPVVVIAHGFAGSQQLMQSFALTFARNGYVAVTFDFPGHGRNPAPLTGSITRVDGATRTLVAATLRVIEFARGLGDGRLALLGHSMASDIVVRAAQSSPAVRATIAVSMFSTTVTATSPPDLLIIDGDWEPMLKREALRAVDLATAPTTATTGVTYGDMALGTARRAAISAHVEHVSVLFSADSMRESVTWLDRAFGITRDTTPVVDGRGPWILLLIVGVVMLARPLSRFLPRVASMPVGGGVRWRRCWLPIGVPMVATPFLLRVIPTHFLPVLVADYLAVHFATYGVMTALCLKVARHDNPTVNWRPRAPLTFAIASIEAIAFGFIAVVWPLDRFVTSFIPGPSRLFLIVVMCVGTLIYFSSDEWSTRGPHAARGAYVASKIAFLLSLAFAIALDPERLFFLIIIVPVILLFFVVYGLFSQWIYARTGHPWIAAIANGVAFAWAIGVTFPLLAG